MDPVTMKFVQRLMAEIFGFVLCLGGVWLLIRGVAGKSSLIVKGGGVQAKLLNASPGLLVAVLGGAFVFMSLHDSKVKRTESIQERPDDPQNRSAIFEDWLNNAGRVTGEENYPDRISKVVGREAENRIRVRTFTVETNATLEALAEIRYGSTKFWRLLAVMNLDREILTLRNMSPRMVMPKGTFMEWWDVSKSWGKDVRTVVELSAKDKARFYDGMLAMAEKGLPFEKNVTWDKLEKLAKENELGLLRTPEGGELTLNDAALKYYQDKKYWRLLQWCNPDVVPTNATGESPLPKDKHIYVYHIIP